jgi:hypothetical protein
MAAAAYESNFASVLPVLRERDKIVADLQFASPGTATEIAKGKLAEIELHVSNGDTAFNQGNYAAALGEFKKARALIFKIIQPSFDAGTFVNSRVDVLLPAGKAVERQIIDTSLVIADGIRPKGPDPGPLFGLGGNIAEKLKLYTQTGFRESVTIEESLQNANEQGIAFLVDNKPAAAAGLLTEALRVARANNQVDPAITAATSLNLSAAFLEMNDPRQAAANADAALQLFRAKNDTVGQAQALHMSAIAADRQGQAAQSKQLLTQAANTLKGVAGGVQPVPGVPAIPAPVVPAPVVRPADVGDRAAIGLVRRAVASPGVTNANLVIAASHKIDDLQPIAAMDARQYTYRIPGRADGWGTIEFTDERVRTQQNKEWMIGVPVGDGIASLSAANGKMPTADQVVANVYAKRANALTFREIDFRIVDTSTTTFYLTHLYAYVLLVKMGDCYKALGQYANAEKYYTLAAGYTYINLTIEATALWIRMANNAVAWGDSFYKDEDLPGAKAQYAKLITENGQVPATFFYNTASLKVPADGARTLIQNILARPLPAVNWEIAIAVLTALQRIQQITDGLDFYGLALSPIHTFEYLQSVARSFAQEAMQAESEFINFKSHQEMEEANRRDLETAKAMADAEEQGRLELWKSAIEDEQASQNAKDLATKRRDDAKEQRKQYFNSSWDQLWAQAASTALSGGQDAYWSEISELADKLDRGETISGPGPKLAAAQILSAGRKTRDYELEKMQENIDELTKAIDVAQAQLDSAQHRTKAAEIAYQAAQQRSQLADQALDAFDHEFFTPESWHKMADVMRDIAQSFLFRAIRIAKLMERAYNFDNDTELKVIKNDYGFKVANPLSGQDTKLFGGDRLLLDVESFTYSAITSKTRKNSRIKDVISIAGIFPAQFEEFRRTGLLSVETDLYEFDRLHPGFYGQRIEAMEINIVGLLPEGSTGLNGSVSAGGVTVFRRKDGTSGKRVHQVDVMALSDFVLRNDAYLYAAETGVRGLFQGIGLGSTWQMHLPKRSNDFDFNRIFDVQFVFYYTAKFDAVLRTAVLAKPPRPGEMSLLRNFGLRYDFPDAWYAFYQTGKAQFTLDRARLPMNQQNFKVKTAFIRVVTKPGISPKAITVKVTAPGGANGVFQTNDAGVVSSLSPQLAALAGGTPVGAWKVEVTDGASLKENNVLKFDRVYNIQFGLEYSYEAVPEAL